MCSFWLRLPKLFSLIVITITLMSQSVGASASDKQQTSKSKTSHHAVKGAGLATCEQFSKARKSKSRDYFLYAGWLDGYLSGFNQYHDTTYDITPWQTTELLLGMLGAHCGKVPKDPFFTAVNRMLPILYKYRLIEKGEVLKISKGNKGQLIHKDVLKLAQVSLKQKGFYQGDINGEYNKSVTQALTRFQKHTKIAQTGMPDATTLYALLMAR